MMPPMGISTPTSMPEFSPDLLAERATLSSFVDILETEQRVLLTEHTEQLQTLADSKIQIVHELSDLIKKRRNKLSSLGINIETGSMEVWLQTHATSSLPVWRDIRQLVERAQQLNHANGELIKTRLRHNQQALNALHKAAHSANGLYGPDGQPHLATPGRTLGSG